MGGSRFSRRLRIPRVFGAILRGGVASSVLLALTVLAAPDARAGETTPFVFRRLAYAPNAFSVPDAVLPPPRASVPAAERDPLAPMADSADRRLAAARTADDEEETLFVSGPHGGFGDPDAPKTRSALLARMGDEFLTAERDGYLVASDLDPDAFHALVNGVLTHARTSLTRDYFTRAADAAIPPVTMYVFRDTASYERNLLRHFRMKPVSPYGHYAHRQRYLVVNADTGPGALVHEMIHSLMTVDFPDAPIWLSEGLASLYEQCRVEGGHLVGEANWRLPELRAALDENRLPTLAALLAQDAKSFRNGPESLNYAHARYFCHYLESRRLLRRLYAALRDQPSDLDAVVERLEAIAGQSLDTLEHDFRAWLSTREWIE